MQRRQFITLVGGSTAIWALAAQAQQTSRINKIFRVGILANEKWPPLRGLQDGLRDLGYVEGQNLELVQRYAEGQPTRNSALAAELVGLPVDIIVTWGTPASLAAKDATVTIPIIMTSGDPVAVGLVQGLAKPHGNVTGFSTQAAELEGKRRPTRASWCSRIQQIRIAPSRWRMRDGRPQCCTYSLMSWRSGSSTNWMPHLLI